MKPSAIGRRRGLVPACLLGFALLVAGCRTGPSTAPGTLAPSGTGQTSSTAEPNPTASQASATVDGLVVSVTGSSPSDVTEFTLRTSSGDLLDFVVGRLELDDGAFPAGHLREHRATAASVRVTYRVEAGERVAYRLTDAP